MTLQELRDELDRTRPAWDELADLDDVLEDGELPALSKDACRHDLVLNEFAAATEQRLTSAVLGSPCGDCRLPLLGAVGSTADRSPIRTPGGVGIGNS